MSNSVQHGKCDGQACEHCEPEHGCKPVRAPSSVKRCPYCHRETRSDGSTFHAAGCAGLETITMIRLQYDGIVKPLVLIADHSNDALALRLAGEALHVARGVTPCLPVP